MGVGFVDAPVSGGEPGAVAGTLAIMCGGDRTDFDAMKTCFDIVGSSALLIGPSGSGSITKLANQVIVNLNIAAVSEALVLAAKAGAGPMKVYHAIRGGLAGSDVGTKALKVRRANVMGQIRPGIPVWQTGEESTFPQTPYVIFPGNVGGEEDLRLAVEILMKR